MSSDQVPVAAAEVLGGLQIESIPEGTQVQAAFLLMKLDSGQWAARSIGDAYNRTEFLGALTSYAHALRSSESEGWLEDDE